MSPQRKKILLVDDEERVLSGLRRRLQGSFDILAATSAREALAAIDRDDAIAVIVADMKMPEMNGVELLRKVREKAPAVRRFMLTGNTDQDTAIAAINDGQVMRFFRKPCDADDLKAALSQALEEYAFEAAEKVPAPASENAGDSGEKARNSFLSIMNHELRTPLNHILGLAGLLETQEFDAEGPQSRACLKQIQESGEHLLAQVNRMLEFARLRSAAARTDALQSVDLTMLIRGAVAEAREAAARKDVTISFDPATAPIAVAADEGEVRLALRELLSNAVKFNDEGGHVSVLVKADIEKAAVRILDTGGGVPAALLEHVREPFRQADESYTREHEGVGLGLALVSTIAELNGADFTLETRPSGGAAATLVFRRASQRVDAAPESAALAG